MPEPGAPEALTQAPPADSLRPRHVRAMRALEHALEGAIVFIVVGSVLAIGSVHPWAYVPLWCACGATGLVVLLRAAAIARLRGTLGPRTLTIVPPAFIRRRRQPALWRLDLRAPAIPRPPLLLPALVFGGWAAVQLAPLGPGGRSLSASPPDTLRGLVFLLALLALHVAAAVVLERAEARDRFRRVLALLGVGLGLTALAQIAAQARDIYGVFRPWESEEHFGPFVNRNHFAGYMLLLAPVALERLRRGLRSYATRAGRHTNLTRRLVALDTPEGAGLLYATVPAVFTVGALAATTSRGALVAFGAALLLGIVVLSRRGGVPIWLLGAAFAAVVLAWFGIGRIEERFADTLRDAPGRTLVWKDSLARMQGHWIAGTGFNTYGVAVYRSLPWTLPAGATPWPKAVLDAVDAGRRPAVRVPEEAPGLGWYREAHNDYLQLLVETGVPGLVIALWAAGAVLLRARSRAWLLAALAGLLLQETVDFSLQIPAVAALFVTLAAWPARGGEAGAETRPPG